MNEVIGMMNTLLIVSPTGAGTARRLAHAAARFGASTEALYYGPDPDQIEAGTTAYADFAEAHRDEWANQDLTRQVYEDQARTALTNGSMIVRLSCRQDVLPAIFGAWLGI